MIDLGQEAARVQNDSAFAKLKTVVIDHTGLAYYNDKDSVLATRICKRLVDSDTRDCQSYLDLISGPSGADELDALTNELTVGETFFFRYSEQYDALRELVVPEILHRNRHTRRIRIWSAGCSNGAEAYSISIMLRHAFGVQLRDWDVTILGTDINRAFLNQANAGRYSDWTLRSLPQNVRDSCFDRSGDQWLLKRFYCDWVTFQYHNLITHAMPSVAHNIAGFDVILCRNVMIYFEHDVIGRLVSRIERCLNESGWLLVGHAESMPQLNKVFLPISVPGATVYRKSQGGAPASIRRAGPLVQESVAHILSPVPVRLRPAESASPSRSNKDPLARVQMSGVFSPAPVEAPCGAEKEAAAAIANVVQLANQGELDAAAELCRDLLTRHSLDPVLHFFNGVILSQLDQPGEAVQSLLRAIELKGAPFALAHYHLGMLRRDQNPRQARVDFTAALEAIADLEGSQLLESGDSMRVCDLAEIVDLQLDLMRKR